MAKISLHRILGRDAESDVPLMSEKRQTWTSRVAGLPRRTLCFLIAIVLFVQALLTYYTLFYEPPLPQAPPYDVSSTVALVSRYYQLLVEMGYLGADSIAYPPHTGINITLAESMGLTPGVIDTMQRLPYLKSNEGGWMGHRDVIFRDSRFVDYRNERDIYMSRDPLGHWPIYNQRNNPKTFKEDMLDWEDLYPKSVLPLTMVRGGLWSTGDAIVLDTATNRIHVISSQGDANHDPFLVELVDRYPKGLKEYKIKTAFYGPEIQYAREANDFLRDFIVKTAELRDEFIPGNPWLGCGRHNVELCPPKWFKWVRDLYHECGWPTEQNIEERIFLVNGTNTNQSLLSSFRVKEFHARMLELKHNISVRYMPDWYTPVPRKEEYIAYLDEFSLLTSEQAAFARSNEEVIPINLEPWVTWGRMHYGRHWALFENGNWGKDGIDTGDKRF